MKDIFRLSLIIVGLLVCGAIAEAQQPGRVPRIGFLGGGSPSSYSARVEAFRQGLKELGYIEGKNITIEYRYADGVVERLPNLAAELVRLKVDVIMTGGPGAEAAKDATKTIPIVITDVADPVGTGLVASLAKPGGNVTGLSSLASELGGKRLELLKEAFPRVSLVAVLWDPTNPNNVLSLGETKVAAGALRVTLQSLEVRGPDDFDPAFSAIKREHATALIVLRNPVTNTHRARILDFAAKSRLPAMYIDNEFTDAGGLMSYGPNRFDLWRRAAIYVDKILKGAKPADLPVEQPTKFEFIINLKTAKQIGLTIPPNVLARADKVIR
jgi:putative ABC transport system substrate-binding protein